MKAHRSRPNFGLVSVISLLCLFVCQLAQAGSAIWSANPVSNDWHTAANWTPNTVPNGPADVATFGQSNITAVTISARTEVDAITFNPGASAFTITVPETLISPLSAVRNHTVTLTLSGIGVTNDSGINQNFIVSASGTMIGTVDFTNSASAGSDNIYTIATGTHSGFPFLSFHDDSAAAATLIANSGSNRGGGGIISFHRRAAGGKASVEVFGNGSLDVSDSTANKLVIGSLKGDGLVYLGSTELTIGSNKHNTVFSGVIQDQGGVVNGTGGSIVKTGTGRLALTNANTYTGSTTVNQGTLAVRNQSGSATGPGPVQVNATLGGAGIIAGSVTVGGTSTGGYIFPSLGERQLNTLTLQGSLTFKSNSRYTCYFTAINPGGVHFDQISCNGLTIENGAIIQFGGTGFGQVQPGPTVTVINNISNTPIAGTFLNLPDGGIVYLGLGIYVQVNYEGDDGNDLTLTIVQP